MTETGIFEGLYRLVLPPLSSFSSSSSSSSSSFSSSPPSLLQGVSDLASNATSPLDLQDTLSVPQYTVQALWWVLWLMGVEYLALWWQGARLPVLHDNLLCLAHATLYQITKVAVRGVEFGAYTWVWTNYAIFPNALASPTFLSLAATVILIDLGYYWLHRASHEVTVLWAVHQVHHTSQDLTVTVGLRHSPLQRLFSWVFYLPLALLGVPPAGMAAHLQFNLLYQCWLHTEAVGTLGPLEYVFNTPQHHRIHHGCNLSCLDKNYGGVLILWDHLFGTFQSPVAGEELVYGILIHPDRFNPLYHQVFYLKWAVARACSMSSLWDALCSLVKGPSWVPGAPWTGHEADKIEVKAPRTYNPPRATPFTHLYVFAHLLAAMLMTSHLNLLGSESPATILLYCGAVVAALTCTGVLYEQPRWTRALEVARCLACLALCLVLPLPPPASPLLHPLVTLLYALSLPLWLLAPSLLLDPRPQLKQE